MTKITVGHILRHFFEDITHFDSKFFVTLRDLLFRPGFLTTEYLSGRRASYLNPVRMYVFISAIFFLILFLGNNNDEDSRKDIFKTHSMNLLRQRLADSLRRTALLINPAGSYDSARIRAFREISSSLDTAKAGDSPNESIGLFLGSQGPKFVLQEDRYGSLKEYDSVQQALPAVKRDGGLLRWVIRTNVRLKERYGSRRQVIVEENFEHSIPKLMFILLPVFALFFRLVYSRKKYYYVQHVIFSIHFHSFIFFLLLTAALLKWILAGGWSRDILSLASWIIVFIYLVVALRNVYHQSVWLSFFKAFAATLFYMIMLILGIAVLALISFLTA